MILDGVYVEILFTRVPYRLQIEGKYASPQSFLLCGEGWLRLFFSVNTVLSSLSSLHGYFTVAC